MKLVAYWRSSWRLWSVRFSLFGAALWTFFLSAPDAAIATWNAFPAEIKALIVPQQFGGYISVILFVLTVIARNIHQPKASAVIEEKLTEKQDEQLR